MSRFFRTATDSDSETSSDEELAPTNGKAHQRSLTFAVGENESKRVVQSIAEKQKLKLQIIINQICNFQKIRDCASLLNAFEELINVYEKYTESGSAGIFFRCLLDVNGFVSAVWEDKAFRQNMTKHASKSLVALRQKVRKCVKAYEKDMAVHTAADFHIIIDDKADSDPEPLVVYDDAGNDSSEWSDSDSTETCEKSEKLFQRDYFLRKNATPVNEKVVKQDKKRIKRNEDNKNEEEKGWQTIKKFAVPVECINILKDEFSVASVMKVLTVLSSSKTKRHSSGKHNVKLLYDLLSSVESNNLGMPLVVKVRLTIATAVFKHNLNFLTAMKPDCWEKVLCCMAELAESLDNVDFEIKSDSEDENLEIPPFVVRGCLVSLVERLDEEFIKMLRDCDPYGDDYVNRLKDEHVVTAIIDKVAKYLELKGSVSAICRIYLCKISHLHYKLDRSVFNVEDTNTEVGSLLEMDRLCKYVYRNDSTNILRTRSILCQIYHLALHDRWMQGRGLMLMSHLQENIIYSDPESQMLFNRAMTQLGLCAFRAGRIIDAHNCLSDLVASGRVKELLGQGFSPFRLAERSREQELRERQFQIPFHMHIPLELVECVSLFCAMVHDIPYLLPYQVDPRRRIISKHLYLVLRLIEKQYLLGPPESMREHIAAACKALKLGQWRSCMNYLINSKMNAKVWSKIQQPTDVKEILEKAVKKAALLVYVLSFGSIYESIKLCRLAENFAIDEKTVRQHLASSIVSEELHAVLDEPTDTLIYQKRRHTMLHAICAQAIEKVTLLLDANERSCRFGLKMGGDSKIPNVTRFL